MRNRIRLSEGQLRKVIKESVKRILREGIEGPDKNSAIGCVRLTADIKVYEKYLNAKHTYSEYIPSPNGKGKYGLKRQISDRRTWKTDDWNPTYSKLTGGIQGEGNNRKERILSIYKNTAHKYLEEILPSQVKLFNKSFTKTSEETKNGDGEPWINSVFINYVDGCPQFVKVYLWIEIEDTHHPDQNGCDVYDDDPYGHKYDPQLGYILNDYLNQYEY